MAVETGYAAAVETGCPAGGVTVGDSPHDQPALRACGAEDTRVAVNTSAPPTGGPAMATRSTQALEAAFLRDVADHPADDAPRLVYADWLEENGQPERAEFIRVQIEHAGLDPDDFRRLPLAERARALQKEHGQRWCEGLPAWDDTSWWFKRGFVSGVVCPIERFLAGAEELRRLVPLEWADLREAVPERLRDLADGPELAGLNHLALWGRGDDRLGPDAARTLVRCRHLGALRGLGLTCQRIGNEGIRVLAGAEGLGPLECLYLDHNFINRWEANASLDLGPLVESPHARTLTTLYLNGNDLAAEGFAQLGSLPNLRAVALGGGYDAAGFRALAKCTALANWRALAVIGGSGRVDKVRALTQSPHLTGLVALELSGGDYTEAAAKALADCPRLASLRHLSLIRTHVHDAGAAALAGSPHLSGLQELDLRYTKITDAGAEALAAATGWLQMRQLDLRYTKVRSAGAAALRKRFGAAVCAKDDERDELNWPLRREWDLRGVSLRG